MLIDDAIGVLKTKSIAEPDVVPPPTSEEVKHAEKALGLKLPPSFLVFLRDAGSYQLYFWETYWVGGDSLGYRNIVKANIYERIEMTTPLPEFLIAFHNNGCGDQLCFDTRRPGPDGEYPIVSWDHELTPEENLENLDVVADSFAEWLWEEVQQSS